MQVYYSGCLQLFRTSPAAEPAAHLGLFLFLSSCLTVTKICNSKLIMAQASRIFQLLSHYSKDSKQQTGNSSVTAQADRSLLLNRQGIVYSQNGAVG